MTCGSSWANGEMTRGDRWTNQEAPHGTLE